MTVRPLTPEEFEQEAGQAFRRVFASTNPRDAPFTEEMSDRAILWGSMYKLRDAEAAALAEAAASAGDAGFYVTMTERATGAWLNADGGILSTFSPPGGLPAKPPVDVPGANFVPVEFGPQEWYVPLSAIAGYLDWRALPLTVENALLSPAGRWGVLFSQHGHLVVGGEPPFVEVLLDRWPVLRYTRDGHEVEVPARRLVIEWLVDLKTEGGPRYLPGSDPLSWGWLEQLLQHIYGREEAALLLETAGIM